MYTPTTTLLTMQDYSTLGVTSMDDRRKLFQLIQHIKTQYIDTPEPSPPLVPPVSSMLAHPTVPAADDFGMPGFPRGYGTPNLDEISKRVADARLSMGRRSGANAANMLGHSKSLSGSMSMAYQQQQQLPQYPQQHRQAQDYEFELQQQQQQFQFQQQQQLLQQQQQFRQQQRELLQQQQQQQQ
ncbi:hypothetical protein BGX34_006917 [Mortierella sp. NVP85]|nr:hypothetical protein BGX34_006917 [Mortierella sp. NVP85]